MSSRDNMCEYVCSSLGVPLVDQDENVPGYLLTSFMQLGSGQYTLPQGATTATHQDMQGELQDLDRDLDKTVDRPDQIGRTAATSDNESSPDVWAHLNSVASDFKSDLKDLLISDIRGRELLYRFCNLGKVDSALVARILIDNELKDNPDKRIPRSLFLDWAHDLVLLFPTTNLDLWYRPYNGTSDGRQSAGGVLYQKYNNKRKTYRKIGLLESEKKRNCPANSSVEINPPVSQADDIRWLENNDEPRDEVISKWAVTQRYRLEAIKTLGIQGYFNNFKALKRADGYVLLDMDFDHLYPNLKNKLFSKWARIAEGLLHVAGSSTSPEVHNFLRTHCNLINEGKIEVLAFLLLPLLLGSVKVSRIAANQKPSRLEISNLFIVHVETLEDLQPKLQARAQTLMASNQTIRPFPVLLGPIDNLVSSRVGINNVECDVCSPLKAIDSCFKSFFALNANYQEGTTQCWLFLEKYVYEVVRKSKKYACVNKLICSLNGYFASQKKLNPY